MTRPYDLDAIRRTIRVLLKNGNSELLGMQTYMARVFGLSRQRISQIVREERRLR